MRKQFVYLLGVLLLAGLLIGRPGNAPAAATSDYTVLLQWGDQAPAGQFNEPMGAAVDAEGYVYVADKDNARIQKFTADGEFVTAWGSLGNNAGQFSKPRDVAVGSSGTIYVIDEFLARVQKFTADGTFLGMWGSQCVLLTGEGCVDPDGAGPLEVGDGQFGSPRGIAVGDAGNVYVVDGNSRVQKFTSDGTFIAKWGRQGTGRREFNGPRAIAVDAEGNVYVGDISRSDNGRIQKFTPDGNFVRQWLSRPIEIGGFRYPWPTFVQGIAVDGDTVYVTADSFVQTYATDGAFLEMWPGLDEGAGENLALMWLRGIAVDAAGHVYVTDDYHRLRKFAADGSFVAQWGGLGTGDRQLYDAQALGIDTQGNVYIGSGGTGFYPYARVQKFDNHGNFLLSFGSYCQLRNGHGCEGAGDGQFWGVQGVAVDSDDNVYILDRGNLRVLKFAPDGSFLSTWGEFGRPMGIAADAEGYVYVTEWGGSRQVKKFRGDGTFVAGWGSGGSGEGQLDGPYGIAVDGAGHVYVADRFNYRIVKFDSDGNFLLAWGSQGDGEGQFDRPVDVAVDAEGYVYVAESYNQRVQKFTPDGEFVTAWGSRGAGPGQFSDQIAIAADNEGHVFVLDKVLNRVQKFGEGQPATTTPTATVTTAATWTPTATATSTTTATVTATWTPASTATATATLTPTLTATVEPTDTATPMATPTDTPPAGEEWRLYLPLVRQGGN